MIAGLLPLMWSDRVGAEVMKPLAAPVLGGMVSSLLHVLIVTPVIFSLIRERGLSDIAPAAEPGGARLNRRTTVAWVMGAILVVGAAVTVGVWNARQPATDAASPEVVMESARVGDLVVTLRSRSGVITREQSAFAIEFRSAASNALIDVGDVHLTGAMAMPGVVMSARTDVSRGSVPGRYPVSGEFGMAGVWKLTVSGSRSTGRAGGG